MSAAVTKDDTSIVEPAPHAVEDSAQVMVGTAGSASAGIWGHAHVRGAAQAQPAQPVYPPAAATPVLAAAGASGVSDDSPVVRALRAAIMEVREMRLDKYEGYLKDLDKYLEREKRLEELEKRLTQTLEEARLMAEARVAASKSAQVGIDVLRRKRERIHSPSKGEGSVFQDDIVCFEPTARPLMARLTPIAYGASLEAVGSCPMHPNEFFLEAEMYLQSTMYMPPWVQARGPGDAKQQAADLFLQGSAADSLRPQIPCVSSFPWTGVPNVQAAARSFHPAFTGELKSSPPEMLYDAVLFGMLGMLGSMFQDVPEGCLRFFKTPPLAYGLLAFPHIGYMVAIEWVGKLFVSIVSQPFFLGTDAHKQAIAALPDIDYSETGFMDLDASRGEWDVWPPEETARPGVVWRTDSDSAHRFHKIITCFNFKANFLRNMYYVYTAYAEASSDADDPRPASLVDAELMFGACAVCVQMPFVPGRDADASELDAAGDIVEAVADAIAWLARHKLLYVDLRQPNVRVNDADRSVVLIDYDDVVVLDTAPPTFAALHEALNEQDPPANVLHWPCVMSALERRFQVRRP